MKSLSSEIIKNYFMILTLFLAALLGINISLEHYLLSEVIFQINKTKEFLVEELKEEVHQNIRVFYKDAILESPQINNLYISIKSKNQIFSDNDAKDFEWSKSREKIFFENGFYILNTDIELLDKEHISVQIIREISKEKRIVSIVRKISFFFFIIFLMFSLIIEKYFYRKIIGQFEKIEEISSKINIGNFDISMKKSVFFSEFSIIFDAYEKMMKRLEKQINSQVEFVQNASHELRTPIQIISGYTNLIDRWGIENEEVLKDSLLSIKSEVKNMKILIEKLMFLAKQEHLQFEKENFSIKEIIEDINYEMSVIYPEANLTLSGKDIFFNSDIALFKQLMRNLIKNAVLYSNMGKVETRFYIQNASLVIKIQDNGIGMNSEQLDKIFEKFYRVDKSRSRNSGGHGLGLSIVKLILDLLEGEIRIESEPSEGTIVTLIFNNNYQEG